MVYYLLGILLPILFVTSFYIQLSLEFLQVYINNISILHFFLFVTIVLLFFVLLFIFLFQWDLRKKEAHSHALSLTLS